MTITELIKNLNDVGLVVQQNSREFVKPTESMVSLCERKGVPIPKGCFVYTLKLNKDIAIKAYMKSINDDMILNFDVEADGIKIKKYNVTHSKEVLEKWNGRYEDVNHTSYINELNFNEISKIVRSLDFV